MQEIDTELAELRVSVPRSPLRVETPAPRSFDAVLPSQASSEGPTSHRVRLSTVHVSLGRRQ